MDREIRRRVEEYRHTEAGPIENNLIDELVGGTWIERSSSAAHLFWARRRDDGTPPQLHRRGRSVRCDELDAQKRGGTIRIGATKAGSSFEPVPLREAGSLAFAAVGEYLTFSNQQLQVRPALATSWKANGTQRSGRSSSAGASSSTTARRSTRTMSSPASSSTCQPRRRSSSPRFPRASSHRGRDQEAVHGRVPPLVADRLVPVPRQPDVVPGDHPTGSDRQQAGHVGFERDDRTGPFRFKSGTPNTRAEPCASHGTGAARPRSTGGVRLVRRHGTAGARPAGGQIDLAVQLSAQEAAAFAGTATSATRCRRQPTGCSGCVSTANRSEIRECGARSRSRSTARTLSSESSSDRARSETTRPSGRSTRRRIRRSVSDGRTSARAGAPPGSRRARPRVHDHHVERSRPTRLRAGNPGSGTTGGHGHQDRGAVGCRVLRRRGRLLRDHAVAQPSCDDHGVRSSWSAQPLPHERVHDRRNLERRALLECGVRLGGEDVPSRRTSSQQAATKKWPASSCATPVITSYFISFVTISSAKLQNYQAEAISHVRLAKSSFS